MVKTKSPVYLFIGTNDYLRDKALAELTSSLLDNSAKELDYKVFYGDNAQLADILEHAATIPLLAEKKIVIVKNADKISRDDKPHLMEYIKKPSRSTCLILESRDVSFMSEDGISHYINVRRFDELSDSDLVSWIDDFVRSIGGGKKISSGALDALQELCGRDLFLLKQELEKLIAFVGNKPGISQDDVEALVGKAMTRSAFDLTGAIDEKKIDEAMSVIGELILSGKKYQEIVGILCWHLKRLMRARILLDRGESESRIAGILKVPRRYAGDFFNQVTSLDTGKIRSRMQVLLEADLDIKRTKYDVSSILEFAVIRMCLI